MFIKAVIELTVLSLPSGTERDDTRMQPCCPRGPLAPTAAHTPLEPGRNQSRAARAKGPPTGTDSTQQTKEGQKASV